LSKERVLNALEEFGISSIEGTVYVYLAKIGPKKATELSEAIKIAEQQLYPILRRLEDRGLIMLDSKKSTTFSALPFDKVLEFLIQVKIQKAQAIKNNKTELISLWESIEFQKET